MPIEKAIATILASCPCTFHPQYVCEPLLYTCRDHTMPCILKINAVKGYTNSIQIYKVMSIILQKLLVT
jgi:hypothetical protein